VTLQCPSKALAPPGTQCGRRERESRREGRGDPSPRASSFTCRDGERHPASREGGALRGAPSKREARSVRRSVPGIHPRRRRADDSGCPKAAEEGNVVALALRKRRHRRTHERSSHAHGRRVLRSVLRPARVNPHYARERESVPVVRRLDSVSRLGKPTRVGGTSTGAGRSDGARLAACHRSREGEAWHGRKGRRSRPSSLRGSRARVRARTSCSSCRSRKATSGLE
jgi:hypothetical protein